MTNTLAENKEKWFNFDWTAGGKLSGGERWSGSFGNSEAHGILRFCRGFIGICPPK
jgi:hypothetical protein